VRGFDFRETCLVIPVIRDKEDFRSDPVMDQVPESLEGLGFGTVLMLTQESVDIDRISEPDVTGRPVMEIISVLDAGGDHVGLPFLRTGKGNAGDTLLDGKEGVLGTVSSFAEKAERNAVLQHFVHFLIDHKGYPQGLLANEVELRVGEKRLRCDTVLYSRELKPQMIIEYKAADIELTQRVFDQITVYNMLLHVDYLIVSNGRQHYCCQMDYEQGSYRFLRDIPDYATL